MSFKGIIIIILGLLALNSFAQVIKMGTVAPDGSPWHNALKEIAQEWRELSNGAVTLRIYPGGVAGDEPDLVRKIRIGQLDAAALTTSGLAYISTDFTALTYPIMINTDEELDYIIKKVGPAYDQLIVQKGFQIVGWCNAGWVQFFSKIPVRSPDDMRKEKFFFWGSEATYIELLKKTGFHPVPLSLSDLLPSLQTGLVSAFVSPPQAALSFQWYKLAPNMCTLRWQPLPAAVVISDKKWQQILAELRPRLKKSSERICATLQGKVKDIELESIKVMVKHGLQIHSPTKADLEKWRELVKEKIDPAFVGIRFTRESFDRVKAALAEFQAQPAKAAGGK